MGSRGTGGFTNNTGQGASGVGGNGGASGKDRCGQEHTVELEDVGRCSYYTTHHDVPPPGSKVSLMFNSLRIEVQDVNGLTVGYLPMHMHYLVDCMNEGSSYSVGVVSSRKVPIPAVRVHIKPQ